MTSSNLKAVSELHENVLAAKGGDSKAGIPIYTETSSAQKVRPQNVSLVNGDTGLPSSSLPHKRQSAAALYTARTSRCDKLDDDSLIAALPELEAFPRTGSLEERLQANPFLMAPMAGVSDAAWRYMARSHGAALAYTEMVSVAGLHFGGSKTWELVEPASFEPDIAVQLFGRKPEQFEEAAALVCERLGQRLALLDINMACPVPKVTRKGEGSALLDEPDHAAKLVAATIRGCEDRVPVTVKIRRGRRMGDELAPEFARAMEAAGASGIAVHGRYANQLYRGEASWECVCRVVKSVSIPVIGSGDVDNALRATEMLSQTGASAAMVARGSYGNPWIFEDAQKVLEGEAPGEHGLQEKLDAFRMHIQLLEATGAHAARARSFCGWYFKGIERAAYWRNCAMECNSAQDFLNLATTIENELL